MSSFIFSTKIGYSLHIVKPSICFFFKKPRSDFIQEQFDEDLSFSPSPDTPTPVKSLTATNRQIPSKQINNPVLGRDLSIGKDDEPQTKATIKNLRSWNNDDMLYNIKQLKTSCCKSFIFPKIYILDKPFMRQAAFLRHKEYVTSRQ